MIKISCIYLVVGLSAVVAQTTILRLPLFHGVFYDLLIPLVVFLSLNLPTRDGIFVVVILGLIMDLISGGTFGLYLSIYFWMYLWVKSLTKFFDVDDTFFQSVLIGVCVLAQHLIFCISITVPWAEVQSLTAQLTPVLSQTIIAALTGPVILLLLGRLLILLQRLSGVPKEVGDTIIR